MATASQVRSTSSRRCDDSTTVRPSDDERRDHVAHVEHAPGVQAVHWLVEDQQLGIPEQAGGNAQPLAHAHGVLRHLVVGPMQDADSLEGRVDAALGRRLTRRGEDLQILAAGQVAVEAGFVDDRPDPGQGHITVSRDGVAEKEHRAGIGVGQAQQHPDQRGLAGTVRSEVAEGAAAGNEELDVVDGDVLAESLGQPVGLDRPLAVCRSPVHGVRKQCCTHTIVPPSPGGRTSCTCHCACTLPITGSRCTLLVQWCRHPVRQW